MQIPCSLIFLFYREKLTVISTCWFAQCDAMGKEKAAHVITVGYKQNPNDLMNFGTMRSLRKDQDPSCLFEGLYQHKAKDNLCLEGLMEIESSNICMYFKASVLPPLSHSKQLHMKQAVMNLRKVLRQSICKESIPNHIPGPHGTSQYTEYRGKMLTTIIDQK